MISERLESTTITITIHGIFDTQSAQEFSRTVQRAYRMGYRDVYVSLKAITIIDKTGMMLLMSIMQKLHQQGCTGKILHGPFSLHTVPHGRPPHVFHSALRRKHSWNDDSLTIRAESHRPSLP